LYFGLVVVNHTWNTGQSGKLVSCGQRSSVGNAGQQGGLAHRGKTDHAHSGVTESTDLEALSCFGTLA